jgi:hypothetical protein
MTAKHDSAMYSDIFAALLHAPRGARNCEH